MEELLGLPWVASRDSKCTLSGPSIWPPRSLGLPGAPPRIDLSHTSPALSQGLFLFSILDKPLHFAPPHTTSNLDSFNEDILFLLKSGF